MSKVISSEQAAALIKDGSTIGASVMGLAGWPEELAIEIEKSFEKTGHPRDITLVHSSTAGDHDKKGATHLGHEGLIKRLYCGNTASAPNMVRLIQEDKIECYLIPQGVICQLWRAIAGNKPGVITKVGLGTYVDPRLEGGKITSITKEDLVELIEINGEEWLLYKKFPIDVAIIRGSVADENGNMTMDREMAILEALPLAMAAKNSGGIVIAQVEHIAKTGTLHPKLVKVPGALVDYVFTAKPENHMQTQQTYYNPAFAGDIKVPVESIPPLPLDAKKIIARRSAMELPPNSIVNLGVGIPTTVSAIAAEEGVSAEMTLTTEVGMFGGIPASARLDFGAAFNCEATIDHASMFDYYDGGGLDVTFLGMAQADQDGNVNVSKFGPRVTGPGGFVNISQNSKKVVFCGNFTTGAELEVRDGKLVIIKEGKGNKFIRQVDQITFSGKYAAQINQPVLYVTERAVFTLQNGAVTLIEIAPGIDLEKDVLALMEFKPAISSPLKTMDHGLFQPQWGKLQQIINQKK
ncbi:MAG: acyl CoA:acetate/3-ketoacid CoA transferase [Firmicutes bacterium]|jgi:propionate CoA-transferase|nr:acyl CoA:acetate/3-ketoacid CoA transferase [Bacillota bacterium]